MIERQQRQRQDAATARRRSPAHPELPRIFVRLAREIDIKTHNLSLVVVSQRLLFQDLITDHWPLPLRNQAPTTPAILHRGTEPPAVTPNCDEVTSSCTSAPVCARSAGAALPVSDSPATKIFSMFK